MYDPEQVKLLIVDDDPDFRSTLARRFLRRGYQIHEAAGGEEALGLAARQQFDAAILDMVMPGLSGLDLLERLKSVNPRCETIMLTGQGSVETAVKAMKLGAFDYLSKPFPLAELEVLIQKAWERQHGAGGDGSTSARGAATPSDEMLGRSPGMREIFRLIERAGPTDKAILIEGESGTGKELVARALHRNSPRAQKPLVVINCAALPETLLESELFGHEKGAFTGAVSAKPGLFEVADGGTLLIDEIGEMPGSLQAKLLRVLEDGSMRRIGSLKEIRVNVRLLAATNRSMAEEVKAGRFREDLHYRINVMLLRLPPLRERAGDIPLLVEHFLGLDWQIEPEALRALERYDWPGNVRQLINAIERGKIMADGKIVRLQDLPTDIVGSSHMAPAVSAQQEQPDELAAIERAHIVDVLRRQGGNKARAAKVLGVNRRSLYRLLDKYEILPAEVAGTSS